MQNETLHYLIKKNVSTTVILQVQNVVICLKALQLCNNNVFHAYIRTEGEVWSYLNLRDQYFTAAK